MRHGARAIAGWRRASAWLQRRLAGGLLAVFLAAAATPLAAADKAPEELLRTEIGYLVDLLKLGETDLAAAHLQLIRELFPQHVAVTAYYQGVIHYRREHYREAIAAFRRVLDARRSSGDDQSDILYYVFRCQFALADYAAASATITAMEDGFGASRLAADARVAVAQAYYQRSGTGDRTRAREIMAGLAARYPKHPRGAWLVFVEAEEHYERLMEGLGNQPGRAGLTPKLRQRFAELRGRYQALRRKYPDSPEAEKADFRLAYLDELLEQ